MREWLLRLTRPEDSLLWAWAVIAMGYGMVGVWLGRRARGRSTAPPAHAEDPAGEPPAAPSGPAAGD